MLNTPRPRAHTVTMAALLCLWTLLAACSRDVHEFYSTIDLPTTVSLYDPFKQETVWEKPIPVGHKLVMDLDRQQEIMEPYRVGTVPASSLRWRLYRTDRKKLIQSDRVPLTGYPIIKVSYRQIPEYPAGAEPQQTPATTTGPPSPEPGTRATTQPAQPPSPPVPDPADNSDATTGSSTNTAPSTEPTTGTNPPTQDAATD